MVLRLSMGPWLMVLLDLRFSGRLVCVMWAVCGRFVPWSEELTLSTSDVPCKVECECESG